MRQYQRLSREERYQIEALRRSGKGYSEIAENIGRHRSTILREIQRNSLWDGRYHPEHAHSLSLHRRSRVSPPVRLLMGRLESRVVRLLKKRWSPEQISGWLRLRGTRVGVETIYRFIYHPRARSRELWKHLRRRKRRRGPNHWKKAGKTRHYHQRKWIEERDPLVDKRERVGDYERDLVLGKRQTPGLLTIVDRTSRKTWIGRAEMNRQIVAHRETVRLLEKEIVHSITNDNGTEFGLSDQTEAALDAPIYFCRPYHSWQRGTNENTNGLIRDYFPKGTDFREVSDSELKAVEEALNSRPRKTLGYRTPNEVHKELSRMLR
jgi:IS30 family transposase